MITAAAADDDDYVNDDRAIKRILTNRELLVSSAMRRTIPMSHILDTKAKQKCMTNSTLRLSKGLLGAGDPMMGSVSMWDAKACRSSLTFMVEMMMMMITDYNDYGYYYYNR